MPERSQLLGSVQEAKTLSISRGAKRARCERCTDLVKIDKRTRGPAEGIK